MNQQEHKAEAEKFLLRATTTHDQDLGIYYAAVAQAHATLATIPDVDPLLDSTKTAG
jgi:hypothetical protein